MSLTPGMLQVTRYEIRSPSFTPLFRAEFVSKLMARQGLALIFRRLLLQYVGGMLNRVGQILQKKFQITSFNGFYNLNTQQFSNLNTIRFQLV